MNVISCYGPQDGRSQVEKEGLWKAVYDVLSKHKQVVFLGGDLNGHVGQKSEGYEGGWFGYGVRNV